MKYLTAALLVIALTASVVRAGECPCNPCPLACDCGCECLRERLAPYVEIGPVPAPVLGVTVRPLFVLWHFPRTPAPVINIRVAHPRHHHR